MEHLHGLPACVWLIKDHHRYLVDSVFYDGDASGLIVNIRINGKKVSLKPSEYVTYSIYIYDENTQELRTKVLD